MHYRAVLPVYADHAGIKYLNLYSILVSVLQCRITGCVGINGALSYSFVLQQRAVQPYCTLLRSHALQCAASDSRYPCCAVYTSLMVFPAALGLPYGWES